MFASPTIKKKRRFMSKWHNVVVCTIDYKDKDYKEADTKNLKSRNVLHLPRRPYMPKTLLY